MITLNSERGFVQVETWKEIEELPGFTLNLNPKEHELKEIIGRYVFKDYIKCGLSDCHTPHGRGYIVSTKSGLITNIGNKCGSNQFGIEFEELSRDLERNIQTQTYKESIASFLISLDLYNENLKNLRNGDRGADSIYKKAQSLLKKTSGCPEQAVSIISKIVRSRTPDLINVREATELEVEELEAMQGKKLSRPYYIEEKAGDLKGISFLYRENDLRDRLVFDLHAQFKAASELDLDNISFNDLKRWAIWISGVEKKLEDAEIILNSGIELLEKDNLKKVAQLISDQSQRAAYCDFVDKNV